MFRLIVTYAHPADPAAFLEHYRTVHAPLATSMPDLRAFAWGQCVTVDGSEPENFLVATLDWDTRDTALASMASPVGAESTADLANFAGAGVTTQFVETE